MEWMLATIVGLAIGLAAGLWFAQRGSRPLLQKAEEQAQKLDLELVASRQQAEELRQLAQDERALRIRAEAQFEAETKRVQLAEQQLREQAEQHREQLRKLSDELGEKFKLHADAALKHQESGFLERAGQRLQPFEQQLKDLRLYTETVEKQRINDKVQLGEQLSVLSGATEKLHNQSAALTTALRGSSRARGEWGETTLRNLVEMAGMSEYCDFNEQEVLHDRSRPDMVVRLPGDEYLSIDSKVTLSDYMNAMDASSEEERAPHLQAHARRVRERMKELAKKDYSSNLSSSFNFVVMFLPGDQFLDAAVRVDRNLIQDAARNQVLISTPVTLLALLKTVQLIWRNEETAKNAQEIAEVANELFDRAATFGEHLHSIGKSIGTSVDRYNKARGSFKSRIRPMEAKLKSLGIHGKKEKEMPSLEAVDPPPGLAFEDDS